ncbi:MAG: FHA domain-containing protein [Anaerolineae bacterium]|nr:FHA domain-containing protein [Anaerolineae bacterium]
MTTCPNCQRSNAVGAILCEYCGYVLDPAAIAQMIETRNLGESQRGQNQPRWGTARFDEKTQLVLRVVDTSHIIHTDIHKEGGLLMGRYDPAANVSPDIDLTGYNAEKSGVSRRHARLNIHDGSLYIVDLNAPNATYLNGLRLAPHQARILRDGDEIRLGNLRLQVTFIDLVEDDPPTR